MSKENKELNEFKAQAREKTAGLILAGFSFVAGLAWNEAIKSFIDSIFVLGQNTLWAKFIYAILVTVLIVIVSYLLNRGNSKK